MIKTPNPTQALSPYQALKVLEENVGICSVPGLWIIDRSPLSTNARSPGWILWEMICVPLGWGISDLDH